MDRLPGTRDDSSWDLGIYQSSKCPEFLLPFGTFFQGGEIGVGAVFMCLVFLFRSMA